MTDEFPPQGVDDVPPMSRVVVLAVQHVLAMYAGAITIPLLIGGALHLGAAQTAYLVSSDLIACGIVTIIQCLGLGPFGVRLPIMMGVTFVSVGPSLAIASNPALGLPGIFGATIVSGVAGIFIAPVFSRLSNLFAPVVTGTALLLIGASLIGVGVRWIAGDGAANLGNVGVALLVIACILGVIRFGRGFFANVAVLTGLSIGFFITWIAGRVDFSGVSSAGWFSLVAPLHFGLPRFDLVAAASMTIVMLITMVESSGMMFALGRMVERPVGQKALARGLRADALGALIGGFLNSLPYTSYAQNIALVGMTGVRSRFVCATAGVILIVLAAIPKLSFLVTAIPTPVLGGAAVVMFGMVAAQGIQTIGQVDFVRNRRSLYVVAISLAVGLVPTMDEKFFDNLPPGVAAFMHNGVMLGIVAAVLLNLVLNGIKPASEEIATTPTLAPAAAT